MNGRNVQATGRVLVPFSVLLLTGKTATHRDNTMTDLSRRAVIKATGAVGASILPVGFASNEATAQEPHGLPAATDISGAQPTT